MTHKITVNLTFEADQKLELEWTEDLKKKAVVDKEEAEIPASNEEVEEAFRKMFIDGMKKGHVFTVPSDHGELFFVNLSKVNYVTLKVEKYSKDQS